MSAPTDEDGFPLQVLAADEELEVGEVPAAAGSALARLRTERAAAAAAGDVEHKDLLVPGAHGIFVRYSQITEKVLAPLRKKADRLPDAERERTLAARILAASCVGIGYCDEDGTKVSLDEAAAPDAPWPRFDARLAALLEVTASSAVECVRALYGARADGAIIATSARVTTWSGYDDDAVEEATGEG